MLQRILLWYRNDLRVADHEALHNAVRAGAQILAARSLTRRSNEGFRATRTGAVTFVHRFV